MSPFIMSSEEFLDWYFRTFLPALLAAAAGVEVGRPDTLNLLAADLRGLPEITVGSGIQPILALTQGLGSAGLHPDQDLLDGLSLLCRSFRQFIGDAANAAFAELKAGGRATEAIGVNRLFIEARDLHLGVLYHATAALMYSQIGVASIAAARAAALLQARNLFGTALSA